MESIEQEGKSGILEEALAREMEEGYRAEAKDPSLESEWAEIEAEGWP